MDEGPDGLKLISDVIQEKLGITMSVLMGANIANEVADEKFCETTIGETWFFSPQIFETQSWSSSSFKIFKPVLRKFQPRFGRTMQCCSTRWQY